MCFVSHIHLVAFDTTLPLPFYTLTMKSGKQSVIHLNSSICNICSTLILFSFLTKTVSTTDFNCFQIAKLLMEWCRFHFPSPSHSLDNVLYCHCLIWTIPNQSWQFYKLYYWFSIFFFYDCRRSSIRDVDEL